MSIKKVAAVLVLMLAFVQIGLADGKNQIQKYFNETACKVKATADPVQKRTILDQSLQTMSKALTMVEKSPLVAKEDKPGIDAFRKALQEKQDELAGRNGFDRVTDQQLDAFSQYVVQDMEQASGTISINIVTLLLIIIILILIL